MKYLIPTSLLIILGLVGTMDYQDARLEQSHYCDMVAQGSWPDYNGIYDKECN